MQKFEDIPWNTMNYEEIDALLLERIRVYEESIEKRGGKRPKREGFLMERIANIDNLRLADRSAQAGKAKRLVIINGQQKRVPNKYIQQHNQNAEQELRELQMMILTLKFPPPGYRHESLMTDAGKIRELVKQNYYPWRILQHAIMNVASPRIFSSLITDTCACIKGKGLHYGVRRLKKKLRRNPELKWFWKTDFKKYYQSLPHEVVKESMESLFKDKTFIRLIEIVILAYDSGEQILMELENENIRNKRNPYWGSVKPDHRKSRNKPHRPHDEAKRQEERVLSVL